MPFDKLKRPEELWEERRKCVQQSSAAITIDELKTIVKQHDQEFIDDPCRDEFLRLIAEQSQASFYHAIPQDDAEVFYCNDADFGMWVVPGSGTGPLDATGKRLMKEAIEGAPSGRNIGGKK